MTKTKETKAEPKTVKMINGNRSNGQVGAVANVAAKDVAVWAAKGWKKVN